MLINLTKRWKEEELMDDLSLPDIELEKSLKDLHIVNSLLNGYQPVLQCLNKLVSEDPVSPVRIVDAGCSDGVLLRILALKMRLKGVKAEFIGVDRNQKSIKMGREKSQQFPEIRFMQHDLLKPFPKDFRCDVVLCNLTLHHFSDESIPVILRNFLNISETAVVINDLQRSLWAYYLFKIFSGIFIKTKIAFHDGLISIRSGFKRSELLGFAKGLSISRQELKWKWAFRYLWVLYPKKQKNV